MIKMQINFRVNGEVERFIEFLSTASDKPKTRIAKDIFIKGLDAIMMPYLAEKYAKGEIGLKKIMEITGLSHIEVLNRISELIDDIEVNDKDMEYSENIAKKMVDMLKN